MVGACTHAAHVRPPGPPAVQAPAAPFLCMPPAAVSAGLQPWRVHWCGAVFMLPLHSRSCGDCATKAFDICAIYHSQYRGKASHGLTEYQARMTPSCRSQMGMHLWHKYGAQVCHRYIRSWDGVQLLATHRGVPQSGVSEGAHRLHCEGLVRQGCSARVCGRPGSVPHERAWEDSVHFIVSPGRNAPCLVPREPLHSTQHSVSKRSALSESACRPGGTPLHGAGKTACTDSNPLQLPKVGALARQGRTASMLSRCVIRASTVLA